MPFYHVSFIDLYFLISAFITQIFNTIAELVILTQILTKEKKTEMEAQTITKLKNQNQEMKKLKYLSDQYNSKGCQHFMLIFSFMILLYY